MSITAARVIEDLEKLLPEQDFGFKSLESEYSIDEIISSLCALDEEDLAKIFDEFFEGVYIDEINEDVTFGILMNVEEGLTRTRRRPGQMSFSMSTGKIKAGPKHRFRLTGSRARIAARTMRRLMRSGKFRSALRKSLKKLHRLNRFKAFMRKVRAKMHR